MATSTDNLLTATNLHKHYRMGEEDLHVLRGVNVQLARGRWLAILGRSGSGKSTLLHLLGGLDRPDQGNVVFSGKDLFAMRDDRVDQYRNRHVGFVFQQYHLLPELTALENVLIASMVGKSVPGWLGGGRGQARQRALQILEQLGLQDRLRHRPNKLSGGERQRVAIARALINSPDLLLADEPTGNLDRKTGAAILELFEEFHRDGQTIVMVTHDQNVANRADRMLTLEYGQLVK